MSKEHQQDRLELKTRAGIIVPLARELFATTALVKPERRFSPHDEKTALNLMVATAPYSHPKTLPDFPRHSLVVALYFKKAAEQLNLPELNPHEAFCIGLLHDWPPVNPHQYLRKNLTTSLILDRNNIGTRENFLGKFPEILSILMMSGFMGRSPEDLKQRGEIQILGDVLDNIGRVTPDGKVRDPHEVLDALTRSRADTSEYFKSGLWPSEKKGLNAMYGRKTNRFQFAINLVKWELAYLKLVKGLNVEALRQEVEEEYHSSENQSFILDFLNAQETLDPEVDRKLGRGPIGAVVFDVGGVLLNVRDEELVENISRKLGVAKEKAQEAFNRLNPRAMAGDTDDYRYLREFSKIVGKVVGRSDLIFPEIYKPTEEMQKVVAALLVKGHNVWIYSNIIPILADVVEEKLLEFYPEIDRGKIIFSCDFAVPKQSEFSCGRVAKTVGEGEILFVDDLENYTSLARGSGAMRGFTFRGNPYKGISPQQRLITELKLAGFYPEF